MIATRRWYQVGIGLGSAQNWFETGRDLARSESRLGPESGLWLGLGQIWPAQTTTQMVRCGV